MTTGNFTDVYLLTPVYTLIRGMSPSSPQSYRKKGVSSMSIEENKALTGRAYEESLNQKLLAIFDELGVPDFVLLLYCMR
jgi:hypothetical protein